jgi:hypothetical protein
MSGVSRSVNELYGAIIASIDIVLNRYRAQPLASFVFVRVFVAGLIRDHVLWSKFTEVERAPTIVFGSGGAKRLDRILPPIYGKDVVTARPFKNVPIFKSSLRSPRSTVLMDSWQKEGLS